MALVGFTLVTLTTVWVVYDASKRDWTNDRVGDATWKWALGCLLLWIVVFPLYLFRRANHPVVGSVESTPAATGWPGRPQGWYPDPYDEMRLRYWTGTDWSDRTAEVRA